MILLMLNVTKQNVVNSRDAVIHNIDELADSAGWQAAITRGDHKLIWGQVMMSVMLRVVIMMIVMLRVVMMMIVMLMVMMMMILTQDYLLKRTQRNRSHSVQLYNVAADPSETHNIAAQFPNIVDSLKAEILAAKNKSFVEADYPKGEMCPAKIYYHPSSSLQAPRLAGPGTLMALCPPVGVNRTSMQLGIFLHLLWIQMKD